MIAYANSNILTQLNLFFLILGENKYFSYTGLFLIQSRKDWNCPTI